jgi:hypothetical protein
MTLRVQLVGPMGADIGAHLEELSGPAKDKLLLAVIRRRTLLIRRAAVHRLAGSGIGRRIWGRNADLSGGSRKGEAGALKSIIGRVYLKNHVFTGEIIDKGLASMVEEGGRIGPHMIAPRHGTLAYVVAGAMRFASGPIAHPGGPVPARPHTAPSIDEQAAALAQDIESVMSGYIQRVTSKGSK